MGSRIQNCNHRSLVIINKMLFCSPQIHNISHCGVANTVSKIRLRFWIVRMGIIVKSIVYRCVSCRRTRKLNCSQIMGDLPVERLLPSPPWTYVSLDYFGPYIIRGEVNRRSKGKVFGVIFNCLVTRAVYVDVACCYNTNSFLQVLRRCVIAWIPFEIDFR